MRRRIASTMLTVTLSIGWLANAIPARAATVTITVDTTLDELTNDGNCSLREAILSAGSATSYDACPHGVAGATPIIEVPAGTYVLSRHGANEDAGGTGDLDPQVPMTIHGAGAGSTIIDGDGADRIFDTHQGSGTITLIGLTVMNGSVGAASGGGIRGAGITCIGCFVEANRSGLGGGGIFGSNLSLIDSLVRDNVSAEGAGGIFGSGILSVTSSVVSGNVGVGGGGISYQGSGTAAISGTTVSGNSASNVGGGLLAVGGDVVISNSTISSNVAQPTTQASVGGGIFTNGATLTLTNSTVTRNVAGAGGGLFIKDTATLTNDSIVGNGSTDPGSLGGGIFDLVASIAMQNVTMDANTADPAAASGGHVYNSNGSISMKNVILGADGGGGACGGTAPGTGLGGSYEEPSPHPCGLTAVDDLKLEPLGDNGGPTQTEALRPKSPALDGGGGCAPTDQRGVPRPRGAKCDAGAYELARCQSAVVDMVGTPLNDTLKGTADREVVLALGGDDVVRGQGGNDVICGGSGDDKLKGGRGNDRFAGGPGRDVCVGGPGTDAAVQCERRRGIP